MILENNKENRELKQIAATMAIENMFVSDEFLTEMIKASKGEKTLEEIRKDVIKKYAR